MIVDIASGQIDRTGDFSSTLLPVSCHNGCSSSAATNTNWKRQSAQNDVIRECGTSGAPLRSARRAGDLARHCEEAMRLDLVPRARCWVIDHKWTSNNIAYDIVNDEASEPENQRLALSWMASSIVQRRPGPRRTPPPDWAARPRPVHLRRAKRCSKNGPRGSRDARPSPRHDLVAALTVRSHRCSARRPRAKPTPRTPEVERGRHRRVVVDNVEGLSKRDDHGGPPIAESRPAPAHRPITT